jgi:hypothetical protein
MSNAAIFVIELHFCKLAISPKAGDAIIWKSISVAVFEALSAEGMVCGTER